MLLNTTVQPALWILVSRFGPLRYILMHLVNSQVYESWYMNPDLSGQLLLVDSVLIMHWQPKYVLVASSKYSKSGQDAKELYRRVHKITCSKQNL